MPFDVVLGPISNLLDFESNLGMLTHESCINNISFSCLFTVLVSRTLIVSILCLRSSPSISTNNRQFSSSCKTFMIGLPQPVDL